MSFEISSQLSSFTPTFIDLEQMNRDLDEEFPSEDEGGSEADFEEALQSMEQVVDPGTDGELRGQYGQNERNWLSFISDLSSKEIYSKRVLDFLLFHEKSGEVNIERSVEAYFDDAHSAKKEDGNFRFSAPTLSSWFSILVKFWLCTGRGDLNKSCVLVFHNLKKWKKKHKKTQAAVFTKENIRKKFSLVVYALSLF